MHFTSCSQNPEPGSKILAFKGDVITFTLELEADLPGRAWVRTNLGQAHTMREEIIRRIRFDSPLLGRSWYDIPMIRQAEKRYTLTLGLTEVGHFEAKCFFLETGRPQPLWPHGDNISISVEPADTCCANIIYNAFVRQFGSNKSGAGHAGDHAGETVTYLDQHGYTVIPPSGKFRDLIKELDFIIGHLGCRILHLLPINPTPTTYGRMGRFGSPYAALDFTGIDPALAQFDPKATPLEQFIELVDAVHARNAKIIIDLAPNHTGWAADLHETHPEWLVRDPDGKIEAPGAWGVVWEDLTRLDYSHKKLWQYVAEVFLTWCRRGVDGFRCDAGYMIPVAAWNYIVASVREEFPDTIFLLEGLGGKISVTETILETSNFNWAYSELFQNYDRNQVEQYLPDIWKTASQIGIMVNYAETHDNNRLAADSRTYAAMRTAFCALTSVCGAFGFANGVEWFATEKINVHQAGSLNWGDETNQVDWIRRMNRLLTAHPAFFDKTELKMIQSGPGNCIAVLRLHRPSGKRLLILVNLDARNPQNAAWDVESSGMPRDHFFDLLHARTVVPETDRRRRSVALAPGEVMCLTADPEPENILADREVNLTASPAHIRHQLLRALALDIRHELFGYRDIEDFDPDQAAAELAKDPLQFCSMMNPEGEESRVVTWQWPADAERQVMVPPGHFLMVQADQPFTARLMDHPERGNCVGIMRSIERQDGTHFTLFMPRTVHDDHQLHQLLLSVYANKNCVHRTAHVLYLARPDRVRVKQMFGRKMLLKQPISFLGTNGRGAMLRAHADWGRIKSKYDGLLAANFHSQYPEDRQMMLIRCRGWLVYQGYSQDICMDCLRHFYFDYASSGSWHFTIPCGQGQHVILSAVIKMIPDENRICIFFNRGASGNRGDLLPDQIPVSLIIRPDIDDRSFHSTTKAYTGPEEHWPRSILPNKKGFIFRPHPDRQLHMTSSTAKFVSEPQWQYMVELPLEADRGMDAHTDLFSPGYFAIELKGNQKAFLTAEAKSADPKASLKPAPENPPDDAITKIRVAAQPPGLAMKSAMAHYLVRRNGYKTVIAGYPWFLDWGRDTLIACRGLIAGGFLAETESILKQFALFEKSGTIPNMIRGSDAGNRDTSDAPLWLFAAARDFIVASKKSDILMADCGGRTFRDILISIADAYTSGTPNGIRMDPSSGLIFSPSHFTWMDTNYPASTPREGYPIEIQALWHHALSFLAAVDDAGNAAKWDQLADRVQHAIFDLYYIKDRGYLADNLCASLSMPAAGAVKDDALRPNQLFAVTLGAISDPATVRNILDRCSVLLVPGAIRSLADQPVENPLPVYHNGRLLNDPHHPYQGTYSGDEDTRRKPAYHNGTAWTWVFPSFCEAWSMAYGKPGKAAAAAWLGSSSILINQGCAGQIPEIIDGNYPHHQRGCDAQAWGVTEWFRVWNQLMNDDWSLKFKKTNLSGVELQEDR